LIFALPLLADPVFADAAGLLLVLDTDEFGARLGHAGKADHFDGGGRPRFPHPLPLVVDHGPDPAVFRPRDEGVALPQGPLLNQDRRHGSAPAVQLGLDDDTAGRPVRIRLEFQDIGLQQDELQQFLDPDLLLGRHLGEDRFSAPLLRDQIVFRQGLLDPP